jgi:hypothetical protein
MKDEARDRLHITFKKKSAATGGKYRKIWFIQNSLSFKILQKLELV